MCRENPRRSGILLFPDSPRFYQLMKTRNRRHLRSFGMVGNKPGESGAFLFSRSVLDFCDGRRSFPINENSNLNRRRRRRWILVAGLQVPYHTFVYKFQFLAHFPLTAKFNFGIIWDRLLTIIRYIGKILDYRQKVNPRSSGIFPKYERYVRCDW